MVINSTIKVLPRNDENLAVAQIHVAVIKLHNKEVDKLRSEGHPPETLFECARKEVVKHFQWVVLHDFLPRIVDPEVLDCVIKHGPGWFTVTKKNDLFMPLEFSAAAFRLGHSMVRDEYQWNKFHASELGSKAGAQLGELFEQTAFSGIIGKSKSTQGLPADWVIDWRRFFRFPTYPIDPKRSNLAEKIDTNFDFHLDQMSGFPHGDLPVEKRSITVRNLLRGFALGLPTGEEVAKFIGEPEMPPEELTNGPHQQLLSSAIFAGKTPLWYYILKEAERKGGNRLGRVGSRIVAETLVQLIKNSSFSIIGDTTWSPKFTNRRDPVTSAPVFEGMVDLLDYAGVVNPYSGP